MTTPLAPIRFNLARGGSSPAALRRAVNRLARNVNDINSDVVNPNVAAKLYLSADTSWSTPGYTDVTWDAESLDPGAWHDLVTNPSRITVGASGLYEVTVMFTLSTGGAVSPQYRVQKNGSTTYTIDAAATVGGTCGQMFSIVDLAASGDYYTVGFSYTGGATTVKGGAAKTWVCVKLIGEVA